VFHQTSQRLAQLVTHLAFLFAVSQRRSAEVVHVGIRHPQEHKAIAERRHDLPVLVECRRHAPNQPTLPTPREHPAAIGADRSVALAVIHFAQGGHRLGTRVFVLRSTDVKSLQRSTPKSPTWRSTLCRTTPRDRAS